MGLKGVTLLTLGDPSQRTGGYLYNARVLTVLGERGAPDGGPVDQITLPEGVGSDEIRCALAERGPALIIVDSIAVQQVVPLMRWLRQSGVIVLALMHMLPSAIAPEAQRVRQVEREFLRQVDVAIAVSPDLARQLIDAGTAPERVRVVLPGRDGVAVLRRRPGRRGLTRFLMVANWTPSKGVRDVVAAFVGIRQSGRRARLDLVGTPGSGAYTDEVRELIATSGFDTDVRVWGTLPSETLAQRYADADVFVLPSRSEGFGIVFAEALSHGLPVIAGRVGPIPAIVTESCGILVEPDNVPVLQEAMVRLANDEELRRRVGRRARRRATHLPTWEESAREFCKIVEDTLRDHRETPGRRSLDPPLTIARNSAPR